MITQVVTTMIAVIASVIAIWSARTARFALESHWRPYVTVGWVDREDGTWLEMRNRGKSSAYSIHMSLNEEIPWADANENPFRYRDVLHPGESLMERLDGALSRHERKYGQYDGRVGWSVVVRYQGERNILPKRLRWRPRSILTSLDADLNPQIGSERRREEYHHVYEIMF